VNFKEKKEKVDGVLKALPTPPKYPFRKDFHSKREGGGEKARRDQMVWYRNKAMYITIERIT
jgi:hypothetical protein